MLSAAETEGTEQALHVTADQLDAALEELLDTRNAMTRVLLGSSPGTPYGPAGGPEPVPGLAPPSYG